MAVVQARPVAGRRQHRRGLADDRSCRSCRAELLSFTGTRPSALLIERGRSEATALDAKWRAVDAYTAQARAGKFSRRPGQRFESLDAVGQAMKLLDGLPQGPETTSRRDSLRDLAIACMALPDLKPAGRVIDRPTGVYRDAPLT